MLFLALSCILSSAITFLGRFDFALNSHSYAFYLGNETDGLSWDEARENSTNSSGYLATITSFAEHSFLMEQLQAYLYPPRGPGNCSQYPNGACPNVTGNVTCTNDTGFDLWIGLHDKDRNRTWEWATEPGGPVPFHLNSTNFSNFASDEPNNNTAAGEYCVEFRLGSKKSWGCLGPLWNDMSCTTKAGWIIEWNPPCVPCEIPLCPTLKNLYFEQSTCDKIARLGEIGSSWTASPLQTRAAQNNICCFLEHFSNSSASCHETFEKTLFADMCTQLRGDLIPQLRADFDADGWCSSPSQSLSDIGVTCPNSTSVVYSESPNVSLVVVEHGLPCVELSQKQFVASQPAFMELGPLAAVQANASQYPDIPTIERVESSDRTTAVLYNTACLQTSLVNLGWLIWLICFYVVAFLCTWFTWKRRGLLPVRARTPVLLYGSVLCLVVNFTWVAIDQITGMTAPCGLISFGNLVAFPMLLCLYLVRSLRLLFLYLSSVSKLAHKRDWFFKHRVWLAPKSAAAVLVVALACFLVVFIVANAVDGTFTDTYLGSGRCKWWDINQAVANAAGAYGVNLGPNSYNQNGFIPYSPEYSSCVFCTSSGTNAFMAVLTAILLLLLLVSLLTMIRLRDQYLLRLELFGVLCLFTAMAILRIVMFFPSSAQLVMDGLGLDISLLLLSLALFLALLITALLPAAMTFSRRYGETARDPVKSEPTFEEMLQDIVGFELFLRFETECFQVENISFHYDMQILKKLDMSSPERAAQIEKIYTTYVQENSLMEVNIDYYLRKKYDSEEARQGPEVFEDILTEIAYALHANSWMRFRKSPLWKEYMKDIAERQKDDAIGLSQMESTNHIPNTGD